MSGIDDTVGIGLLGFGTVGSAVYRLLDERGSELQRRIGLRLVVVRVAVANLEKAGRRDLTADLITRDPGEVVRDQAVDVVVEVMGGVERARPYVLQAIELGKPVVTANKQLMAAWGPDLLARAQAAGVDLGFEGSVGTCIPLVKSLRESLAGDRVRSIEGILNGTTNYILTRMSADGWSFDQALAAAQAQGFAEADPSDDIEGHDSAAKLAILATLAFDARVTADQVYREGISRINPQDIAYARELGFVIKLLAVAADREGRLDLRVHPALLPQDHPLAAIADERNAVLVRGEGAGSLVFSGAGAGGSPTAVAVVGDIIDAARHLRGGVGGRLARLTLTARALQPIEELVIPYYFNLQVLDRPGVFARVATIFGEELVSIASIVQKSRGEFADVVLVTHESQEAAVRRVVARLREMPVVKGVESVIRVAT